MAGAGGIEPPNAGIKIRCLTAWRRPNRVTWPCPKVRGQRRKCVGSIPDKSASAIAMKNARQVLVLLGKTRSDSPVLPPHQSYKSRNSQAKRLTREIRSIIRAK